MSDALKNNTIAWVADTKRGYKTVGYKCNEINALPVGTELRPISHGFTPLTIEQIKALTPKADGMAEADKKRVEVLPGVWGSEYSEVDAWSFPLVLELARAIEAAHGITQPSSSPSPPRSD